MSQPPAPVRELTLKSIALGLFLAFVFGSANAYLGMKAGQTVAATIPAAVIAMALFRLPAFKGGILEQNITRTAASVGEALVAGAIFTLPAFLLVEVSGQRLWTQLRGHYWDAVVVLLAGGLLGIFFIILLRRPLCGDRDLPWPESVASAQIVKAGQESGEAPRLVFGGMLLGALVQYLKSDKGLQVFREYVEGFLAFPKSVIRHFDLKRAPIAEVTHAGGVPWSTPALSPALMGIGYIIGPRLSAINVSGGILAWWVLIPLLFFFDPDLSRRLGGAGNEVAAYTLWYNVVRPIAVGMMLVGAASTMFSMRHSIARSLLGAFHASTAGHRAGPLAPTEQDIPARWVLIAIAALMAPLTALFTRMTGSFTSGLLTAAVMGLAGFLLAAVGGYLVGLVGSSNQPLSGLTLSGLVLAALLMQLLGLRGAAGVAAVLGVAAVVALAVSVSGSLIQDLKAGQLLGGTPWKMQAVEIVAVALLAFFLFGPILVLHEANLDTGGIGGRALPAPQAGLMAQLAKGIVSGDMAWGLLGIGAAFGVALLLSGARAMMLIAVGMYLPFDTSSAIFTGGIIKWFAGRAIAGYAEDRKTAAEETGTLLASGLIAGEAIAGILLAALFLAGAPSLTRLLTGADEFSWLPSLGGWLSLACFALLAWVLIVLPKKRARW
ncbi:MAG: oligopeptide transporter, OPT family [Bryobacterales bacterium]|nr:oligopeptide transporter, OPT family [Bryobacterales bacterium]